MSAAMVPSRPRHRSSRSRCGIVQGLWRACLEKSGGTGSRGIVLDAVVPAYLQHQHNRLRGSSVLHVNNEISSREGSFSQGQKSQEEEIDNEGEDDDGRKKRRKCQGIRLQLIEQLFAKAKGSSKSSSSSSNGGAKFRMCELRAGEAAAVGRRKAETGNDTMGRFGSGLLFLIIAAVGGMIVTSHSCCSLWEDRREGG